MMLDADVVAVSPSSVYRVFKAAGRLAPRGGKPPQKGQGFEQPLRPIGRRIARDESPASDQLCPSATAPNPSAIAARPGSAARRAAAALHACRTVAGSRPPK